MNSEQLAKRLKVNRVTLFRYREKGIIPAYTSVRGTEILWDPAVIDEIITGIKKRVAEMDSAGDAFKVRRWERHISSLDV